MKNEKYDNEHIFYRTENIENNLEKLKEKGIDNLKFSSWKEFEDNVVAKGFEKSLFIKSFNITK